MPLIRSHALAPAALLTLAGVALAADDFSRLAPPEAGLVVCIENYERSKAQLMATPLGRLTEAPEIAELLEEARKEQMAAFESLAAELGIEVEEWPEPAGMVGLASVLVPVEDAEEWGPQFTPQFVGVADFGPRIDQVRQIVDAIVDRGLDQGLIEIETEQVGGVEVLTFTTINQEADEQDWESPPEGLAGFLQGLERTTYAISGSTLFVGSDRAMVMDCLDRERGADLPSAADDDQFAAALAQHPEGTTDYLVVFPGRMGFVDGMGAGLGFFLPGIELDAVVESLGIAGMKAISLGAHLESNDAQAEFSLGILDNQRSGIVSLLDVSGQAWDPPMFVSPDAVSTTRMLVDFARIPDVAREFWSSLPAQVQDEGGMYFEQVMMFVEPIAPLLGPEVHIVQTLERPLGASSAGQVFVIPTSDELPLNNLLSMGAGAGLTTRTFNQTRIYDTGQGFSLAVAFGNVFIGADKSVENALRLMGGQDSQDLGDDASFQAAMRPHPTTGNVIQFTRTIDVAEFSLWALQNAKAITIQQMRDLGTPEEYIQQYQAMPDETPEWAKTVTPELLARGIGDISMEIAPADDGFRGRILIHSPR